MEKKKSSNQLKADKNTNERKNEKLNYKKMKSKIKCITNNSNTAITTATANNHMKFNPNILAQLNLNSFINLYFVFSFSFYSSFFPFTRQQKKKKANDSAAVNVSVRFVYSY